MIKLKLTQAIDLIFLFIQVEMELEQDVEREWDYLQIVNFIQEDPNGVLFLTMNNYLKIKNFKSRLQK